MSHDDGSAPATAGAEPFVRVSRVGEDDGAAIRGARERREGSVDARREPLAPDDRVSCPSRQPKLVASDLDGTLLDAQGRVTAATQRVWSALARGGVQTLVVTARPPRWLDHLTALVGSGHVSGPHTLAICGNGAFVYDLVTREVVEAHGFGVDEAVEVIEHVTSAFPDAGAAVETDLGMFRAADYPDLHAGLGAHDVGVVDCEIAEIPADAVVGKILLRDEAWRDDTFVGALAECLGERGVLAYSGAAGLAEISAPGVTKATRLASWCAARGIDAADVWAFGDMPNDIPMLTWAGRGVAVANAHPDVRAIADDVCGHHASDGVANYLSSLL